MICGFVDLTGANYTPVSGGQDSVSIDIYDMGSKLNAFGIFQSRKDRQASSFKFGAASIASDDYLAFHKDRFYVEIQAYITDRKETSGIDKMATIVAQHLPGDNTLPMELSYLPDNGKVAGSERYVTGGILGYAFLDRGLVCDYQVGDQKVKAFIAMLASTRDAVGALQQHRLFLEKSGKKGISIDGFGKHGFVSEEPYHKKIIETQAGAFVIGVYDLITVEAGQTLLADILKKLPS